MNETILEYPFEPFPAKKYDLIYADPPWKYNDKSKSHGGGAECHYSCLSYNDLCLLPVSNIAQDNSVLLMWATYPQLDVAIPLLKQWGFEYKTVAFTWIKTNKDRSIYMGMGRYTRSNPEICLLGRRGKGLFRQSCSVMNAQFHARLSHSEKPQLFRDRIFDLFGNVSKIELFARKDIPGWDVWGNETSQDTLQLMIPFAMGGGK